MYRTHAITDSSSSALTIHRGAPASGFRRVERPRRSVAPPNYAARRLGALFVAVVATLILSALLSALLESFGGSTAAAAEAPTAVMGASVAEPRVVVARDGDSLWSIADATRGRVGRDAYVDALIELNGSTTVYVGQAILLPAANGG